MIAIIIIVIAVMMLRYAKRHMFDIQRYTDRAIFRIVTFVGRVSSAERSLDNTAA